jgi:hypothetical protein
MATIVTRAGKGSPLTNTEVDSNFTNLNTEKLESGDTAASLTITSADINGGTIDGVTIGGSSAGAITGTTITGTSFVTSGNMTFGDNDKAIFGAGSDLQIYHDGSHSWIHDAGTGNLKLRAEDFQVVNSGNTQAMIFGDSGGAVTLYYTGSPKLATTSTGIDVTGTVTADDITISDSSPTLTIIDSDTNATHIIDGSSSAGSLFIRGNTTSYGSGGAISFFTKAGIQRLKIDNDTGDISFYEDTGTTAKFFWDASAESLGIGTTSPSTLLHLDASSDGRVARFGSGTSDTGGMYVTHNSGSTRSFELSADNILILDADRSNGRASSRLQFNVDGTERMRIDSSGNVGIGTSSITNVSNYRFLATNSATGGGLVCQTSGTDKFAVYNANNDGYYDATSNHIFRTGGALGGSERMRIDSSGNVGIGTSTTVGTAADRALVIYGSGNSGTLFLQDSNSGTGSTNGFSLASSVFDAFLNNRENGNMRFYNNGSERMRIDSSGNVGIGTTSNINGALTVFNGTDFSTDSISNGDNIYLISDATSGDGVYGSSIAFSRVQYPDRRAAAIASVQTGADEDNVGLAFFTHPSGTASVPIVEAMRIDSSGNLLVGTTTPLSSASTGEGTSILNKNAIVVAVNGSDANLILNRTDSSTGDLCIFRYNGATKGSISTNGTTTAYNTTSDYRLKEDWQPMSGSIDRLKALNPVNFAWKVDGSRVDGFLAHEAAEVVPEAVSGEKDAMRTEEYEVTPAVLDDDGNVVTEAVMGTREVPDYQGIDQSKLVPLLTAALQEAVAKIEALETRIAALESN